MKRLKVRPLFLVLGCLLVLAFFFQNCGQTGFTVNDFANSDSYSSESSDNIGDDDSAAVPVVVTKTEALLSWDAVVDASLAGYKIYYGNISGGYSVIVDVGNLVPKNGRVEYTVKNLDPSKIYYFSTTAYDTLGVESDFSDEYKK